MTRSDCDTVLNREMLNVAKRMMPQNACASKPFDGPANNVNGEPHIHNGEPLKGIKPPYIAVLLLVLAFAVCLEMLETIYCFHYITATQKIQISSSEALCPLQYDLISIGCL